MKLIAGPGVFICNECIKICNEIIDEDVLETALKTDVTGEDLPKPNEIKEFLDQYVVGQDQAKKILSVSVYNHYKRIRYNQDSDVEIGKTNLLMIGPTGVGKTLLVQSLSKILNVPFAIADATSITEAGYAGEDVENFLLRLIQAANGNISKAEKGIIYIDEIDKIARRTGNVPLARDVSGEGVQQALLKILEGTVASVPMQGGRKHPYQECIQIDTSNILFICGGSFEGLENIIENRLNEKVVGFGAKIKTKTEKRAEILKNVTPEDLFKYGFIPEFVGRIHITATFDHLTEDDLVRVLTEPKNALVKQYIKLFEIDNIKLEFHEEALRAIAREALERKTGARGLRSITEEVLLNLMYEAPSKECSRYVIKASNVANKETPITFYLNSKSA